MERAVQVYAVVNFVVIGLSHALRPRAWVAFFVVLRGHGEAGVFAVAILNLIFGSIVVGFHHAWTGIPLVLTLVGWANVAKALAYLAFPAFALRKLQALSDERAHLITIAGVFYFLLAALLGYHLWRTA